MIDKIWLIRKKKKKTARWMTALGGLRRGYRGLMQTKEM